MGRTLGTQLLDIIQEYAIEHDTEEIDLDAVAAWACRMGKYQRQPISMQKQCKREMATAMRQTRHEDPQGREVRTKHAVELKIAGEQMVLWVDIRTAKPTIMQMSFTQNRHRIANDVKRHATDVDSYNDNNLYGTTVPVYDYDFNKDLLESNMSGEYDDNYDEDEDNDND